MRRNTREPHARRLPALLALRPLAPGRAAAHGRRLPAGLARPPPPRPPPLARRPARRLPRRAGGDRPGPGVAGRAVRRPAPASPHGAAPAAHDGGAAAAVAGCAAAPRAPVPAAARPRVLGRPAAGLAAAAPVPRPVGAPAAGARALRRRHLALALPAGLRPGPALGRLALLAARLLPGHRPAVLVSRRPALPGPAALVALAPAPVPDPGRRGEHRRGGRADVFRPRPVSLLRGGAAPGRAVPARRPVGSGRPHVGAGVGGLSPSPVWHRRPAPLRGVVQGAHSVLNAQYS